MDVSVSGCTDIDYLVTASYYSHHWSLVLIDVHNKVIYYLDPKENYVPQENFVAQQMGKCYEEEVPNRIVGWKIIQYSDFKCGVPSCSTKTKKQS